MRKNAREAAFTIIFSKLFHDDCTPAFRAAVYKKQGLTEEDAAYASRLVALFDEHRGELSAILQEKVENFAEERVYPADRAVLYLALAEIKYVDDVPPVVSVSEAAALARKFSTEQSADFVNGVLGGVINAAD